MSYTVWAAFDSFRKSLVDLDPSDTDQARTSRDYLFGQLKSLAKKDGAFPRLWGNNYVPYGSFSRKTKIRPLDDIDFLLLLDGSGVCSTSASGVPYSFLLHLSDDTKPLARFRDDYRFVNSIKVLNQIKSSLSSVGNYRKADIGRDHEAVVLELLSYTWAFDIVPAIPFGDPILYYMIPDGKGNWKKTDPRIDAESVTRLNQRHSNNLLPVLRLLKYWNRRRHKPALPSFYFETLVLKVFEAGNLISAIPNAIQDFFDRCDFYLRSSCPNPNNLGPNLDADVDWETRNKVTAAMKEAASKALTALVYQTYHSDDKTAIGLWGEVFGPDFPKYG